MMAVDFLKVSGAVRIKSGDTGKTEVTLGFLTTQIREMFLAR